jgi:hypothetical protein
VKKSKGTRPFRGSRPGWSAAIASVQFRRKKKAPFAFVGGWKSAGVSLSLRWRLFRGGATRRSTFLSSSPRPQPLLPSQTFPKSLPFIVVFEPDIRTVIPIDDSRRT